VRVSSTATSPRVRRAADIWAVVADLVCLLGFAAGGRSAHEAHSSWLILFVIVWPYALACLVVHDVLWRRGVSSRRVWPGGVAVLVVTYVVGMLLRWATGRGIALGFLIVAICFLTLTMIGWRVLLLLWRRRRASFRAGSQG